MSTLTENLQLVKPEITDPISLESMNQNLDIIDANIGELKTDYVISQGIQDGWIYRRWSSGIVEQWKSTNRFDVQPTKGSSTLTVTNVTLPVPMASSDFNVQVTLTNLTGGNVWYWTHLIQMIMNQTVGGFDIITWNDGNYTATIATHIYVIGRWKK